MDVAASAPTPKPHHAGHRERLRDRARGAGIHHLPDYELLELFLFRSQPQGDVKPIAKALLARFGSLAAVLAAPVEDLITVRAEDTKGRMKGIGAETALKLEDCPAVVDRLAAAAHAVRPDAIILVHGGPVASPADAEFVLKRAAVCHGFYGASSMERLPAEIALTEQTRAFKRITGR